MSGNIGRMLNECWTDAKQMHIAMPTPHSLRHVDSHTHTHHTTITRQQPLLLHCHTHNIYLLVLNCTHKYSMSLFMILVIVLNSRLALLWFNLWSSQIARDAMLPKLSAKLYLSGHHNDCLTLVNVSNNLFQIYCFFLFSCPFGKGWPIRGREMVPG